MKTRQEIKQFTQVNIVMMKAHRCSTTKKLEWINWQQRSRYIFPSPKAKICVPALTLAMTLSMNTGKAQNQMGSGTTPRLSSVVFASCFDTVTTKHPKNTWWSAHTTSLHKPHLNNGQILQMMAYAQTLRYQPPWIKGRGQTGKPVIFSFWAQESYSKVFCIPKGDPSTCLDNTFMLLLQDTHCG